MKNLFEVGEEVVLTCCDLSMNGECVVIEVMRTPESMHRHTNGSKYCGSAYGYHLADKPSRGSCWCECALKKRYKPGDSFESIMDSLKQPIKQPVMVEQGDKL